MRRRGVLKIDIYIYIYTESIEREIYTEKRRKKREKGEKKKDTHKSFPFFFDIIYLSFFVVIPSLFSLPSSLSLSLSLSFFQYSPQYENMNLYPKP